MLIALNILFGLFPTFALAAAVVSDERKPVEEQIAGNSVDRHRQKQMFLLVYGLWSLTLAMWNWMRSAPLGWIVLWTVAGVSALAMCAARRKK